MPDVDLLRDAGKSSTLKAFTDSLPEVVCIGYGLEEECILLYTLCATLISLDSSVQVASV